LPYSLYTPNSTSGMALLSKNAACQKSAKIRPHEQLVITIWYLKIIVNNNRNTLVRIWLKSMAMQRIVQEFNDKLLNCLTIIPSFCLISQVNSRTQQKCVKSLSLHKLRLMYKQQTVSNINNKRTWLCSSSLER